LVNDLEDNDSSWWNIIIFWDGVIFSKNAGDDGWPFGNDIMKDAVVTSDLDRSKNEEGKVFSFDRGCCGPPCIPSI